MLSADQINSDFVIVALDVPDRDRALRAVEALGNAASFYKIGLELFCAAGLDLARELSAPPYNKKIFLDLKLNDIPNTVSGAVTVLQSAKPRFLTLYAEAPAIAAARAVLEREYGASDERARILNVTVLTSLDDADLARGGIELGVREYLLRRALMSLDAGADGVICSAQDLVWLRPLLPVDFLCVTPGIRMPGGDTQDQKRVATPAEARQRGANHIVMGRDILGQDDPVAAMARVLASLRGSL